MIRGTGKSPGRLFADGRIQFRGRSPQWATITPDNTHFLPTPLRREGATVGVYDGWLQLFDFFGWVLMSSGVQLKGRYCFTGEPSDVAPIALVVLSTSRFLAQISLRERVNQSYCGYERTVLP